MSDNDLAGFQKTFGTAAPTEMCPLFIQLPPGSYRFIETRCR